jgi:hypothetical protein
LLRIVWIVLTLIVYTHAEQYILNYQSDITLSTDNKIRYVEKIHYVATPQNNMPPFMLYPTPRDLEVLQNGKKIGWYTSSDYNGRILLKSRKQPDFNYRYTLIFKGTIVPYSHNEEFDEIEGGIISTAWPTDIRHFEGRFHLPEQLNQENIDISFQSKKAKVSWISDHVFSVRIDNIDRTDLVIKILFPKGLLGQNYLDIAKNYSDSIGPDPDVKKHPDSLAYWNLVLLLVYALILYYFARAYGSFGAMGSIPVCYKPPKGMSLLQSGFIIDEKHDTKDIMAAIIELASLGYIKIQEKHGVKYLKKLKKHPEGMTIDQEYLFNNILFRSRNFFILDNDNIKTFQNLFGLKQKIEDRLKLGGYLHFNIKRAQLLFMTIALLMAFPVYIFSLYTIKLIYPPDVFLLMIYYSLFLFVHVILTVVKKASAAGIAMYFFIAFPLFFMSDSWIELLAGPVLSIPAISILIIYFDKKISRLTGKGLKVYKELQGYKEFIKRTEAHKLEHLLKEDPEYVDQHLAYALMFEMISHDLQDELT